jgi:hypothetical protein
MRLEHLNLAARARRPLFTPVVMVVLAAGAFLLSGPGERLDAREACVSGARFELEPQAPLPDGLQGKLILRPKDGKGEPLTLAARVGASVTAGLPCASQWEVAVDFPNVWGPRKPVVAGAAGASVSTRLALWPLGRIAGSVQVAEKGMPLPKKIVVKTLAPRTPARRDTPQGAMDCPVDAKTKRWSCPPLPATAFDLVLSVEGFVPQYRWDLNVSPGKTTEVGTLSLKKGASVAGWVEVDGGAIDPACLARLTPLAGPGGAAKITEKLQRTASQATVRKDGFFQLVGVPPGTYSLEVRQPGFAASTVQPVAVSPKGETLLRQPVVLARPLDLELSISPPLDWLGKPWNVQLFQASSETGNFDRTIYVGKADPQGSLKIPRQTPGRFRTFISDSLDNQLALRTFQVTGPEDASQAIQLKILTLRGTVKLGKDPLVATLWFGGRHGSTAVKMESDRDGKFLGVLPRDGWWVVDVDSTAPRFATRARVKVDSDEQDRATAEVDLPATRVYGKVVDEAGHPMPGATVALSTDQVSLHADTDETGSFDFRGLTAGLSYGLATLSTAQGEWSSDRISLFLQDGEDTGPLEVRMRKETKLSGSVQSIRGPVSGAGVTVLTLRPTMIGGDSTRTDLDGSFTAQLPASTELADVIVSAPGYGLKAFPTPVSASPAQPLVLDEQSGDLQILLPSSPEDGGKDTTSLMILQNGLPVPTGILAQWAGAHGQVSTPSSNKERTTMTVPDLAPGEYQACIVPQSAMVPWEDSGFSASLAKCADGTLTAGGTLRLDMTAN